MRTEIIAEIASSHNQNLDLAKALIRAAADNGADWVKWQDWRADNVPGTDPDKKRYERYQFPEEWYVELIPYCEKHGVKFLTTCFNADRAAFLAGLGLKTVKLASISMTNTDLLMAAALNFEELIVSTAFHSREEIEEAIDLLQSNAQKFTLMVCTGNYPLDYKDANLNRIDEMKRMLDGIEYASVGYSDHSLDPDVPMTALAKGITYLEKHFSLSRYLPQTKHTMYEGGDALTTHEVSIEPHELEMIAYWRDKISDMCGTGEFTNNEVENKIKSRYSGRYGK